MTLLAVGLLPLLRPCTEVLEEPAGHCLPCGPQQPKPVDVDPVCEVCLTFARVPYGFCSFCGAKPSYHHGRCCVKAPDWGCDAHDAEALRLAEEEKVTEPKGQKGHKNEREDE